MTGFSAPCKNASPFAAPMAIFNLVPHGSDVEIPGPVIKLNFFIKIITIKLGLFNLFIGLLVFTARGLYVLDYDNGLNDILIKW